MFPYKRSDGSRFNAAEANLTHFLKVMHGETLVGYFQYSSKAVADHAKLSFHRYTVTEGTVSRTNDPII